MCALHVEQRTDQGAGGSVSIKILDLRFPGFSLNTLSQNPGDLAGAFRRGFSPLFLLGKSGIHHQPRRLWRRYVLLNPQYVALVAAQVAGLIDFDAREQIRPETDLNLG